MAGKKLMSTGPAFAWRTLFGILLSSLLTTQTLTAQTDNTRNKVLPTPLVTRHTRLYIPFSVDQSAQQVSEVQLYVSVNEGRDWEVYARQPGPQGKFDFRAPREGSYWFCSRTLDAQKQLWPKGDKHPELIIVVDVTQPKLQLFSRQQADGRILLQWEVQDRALRPNSFQLASQATGDQQWAALDSPPLTNTNQAGIYRGKIFWQPQGVSPLFTVQATVSDQAGNQTIVRRQVTIRDNLPRTTPPAIPKTPASRAAAVAIPDPDRLPNLTQPNRTQPDKLQPDRKQPAGPQAQLPAIPWPVDKTVAAERPPVPAGQDREDNSLPDINFNPLPAETKRPAVPATPTDTHPQRVTVAPATPTVPDQSPFPSAPSQLPAAPATMPTSLFADNTVQLPPGAIVRSSNSRYFQLEYELENVAGKEETREIQLWATADGGRTWKHWGNDQDRQSPFQVQVRYEGIFGFRIAVTGKQGLAGRQPTQGDPADIWLRVDTTPPEARIQSATFGSAKQTGNLVIRWKVEDLALAERAIKLSYREKPADPWTMIAAQLPNRGTYAWPVSPRVPKSIYLRLDATDLAGNTGTYQHPTPITLHGLAPTGRIRAVQPLPAPEQSPAP